MTRSSDSPAAPDPTRAVRLTYGALAVSIVVAVVGGVVAALIGRGATRLGSGYGGLFGIPAMLTTVVALAAIPVAIRVRRDLRPIVGWWSTLVIVVGGAWVVAIGYGVVAHVVDPCLNGWWDINSGFRGQPLCERFGGELNWHTRLHLLAHAAPAAGLLTAYVWAVKWAVNRAPAGRPATEAGVA